MAKKSAKLAGDITMLINNAGIVGGKSFLEADDAMVQKTFEVNSISHFWTTKAFLPKMVENNHGHIGKKIIYTNYCRFFSFFSFFEIIID